MPSACGFLAILSIFSLLLHSLYLYGMLTIPVVQGRTSYVNFRQHIIVCKLSFMGLLNWDDFNFYLVEFKRNH